MGGAFVTQMERDLAVLRENTSLLSRRLLRETEKRLPLLEELANLARQESRMEEDLSPLARMRRAAHAMLATDNLRTDGSAITHTLAEAYRAADCAAYIEAYLSLCEMQGEGLAVADLLPVAMPSAARITYVRNAYADEAYEDFTALLPEPTVQYADSFREACSTVAAGEADFCILPYRSSAGLLASFAEMAAHHSLYICALCRVFHADGTDATHFALYGRALLPPEGDGMLLRCSFLCPDTEALSKHICAAAMLGVELQELSAEPYAASEGSLLCKVTAFPQKERLLPWLAYLLVFADGGACHGLYKEI